MNRTTRLTPLAALGNGLVAGVAGTAALTASQLIEAKLRGSEPPTAAGEVGKRTLRGVFLRDVPDEREPALNQAVHWAYGTAWGGLYGLIQETVRLPPARHGLAFGAFVGSVATAELPALRLMPPPWRVPPRELTISTLHHLVYGLATAATFRILRRKAL